MSLQKTEQIFSQLRSAEVLPNYQQECLLQATLLSGETAVSKWKEWKDLVDIDLIDHHSNRLLPLLYHNLTSMKIEHQILGRYKGVSRKNWYKNQLLFNDFKFLLSIFQKEGIDTIVVKGAALALQFYPSFGLRPMADLDLLVREQDVSKALNVLRNSGWKSIVGLSYAKRESPFFKRLQLQECYLNIRASCGMRHQSKREFDLHKFVLADGMSQTLNNEFWEQADEIELEGGLKTNTLCTTDMLLHIVVHGLRPGKAANLRWIADAYQIQLKSKVDWNRLLRIAIENDLMENLAIGLVYLKTLLNFSIPDTVLTQLNQVLETYDLSKRSVNDGSRAVNFSYLWERTKVLHSQKSVAILPFKMLQTVQCHYLLKHAWQVPLYVIYKAIRKK